MESDHLRVIDNDFGEDFPIKEEDDVVREKVVNREKSKDDLGEVIDPGKDANVKFRGRNFVGDEASFIKGFRSAARGRQGLELVLP